MLIGYGYVYNKRLQIKRIFGINIPANEVIIGSGTYGIVYDVGNGMVLKITGDPSEAQASNKIAGKKLKYVNEIYAVFQIQHNVMYYGIIQKKLNRVDWIHKKLWDAEDEFMDYLREEDLKDLNDKLFRIYYNELEENYPDINGSFLYYRTLGRFYRNAKAELERYNIWFEDFHTGNIMQNGNQLKVIDLGISATGGLKKIVTLESLIIKANDA